MADDDLVAESLRALMTTLKDPATERAIRQLIDTKADLARQKRQIIPVPGIGPVTATTLLSLMP